MEIPLGGIFFKDEISRRKLEPNKGYFINLDDEFDEKGNLNSGTHWTCFLIAKYKNGELNPIYFDPFGTPPPEPVKDKIMKFCHKKVPFTTKNIQSLMGNACGWFCCAYLGYIFNFSHRTGDLYIDTEQFLSYFEDLNISIDWKKNEYILKHFFQSKDPSLRREIDVIAPIEEITEDTAGGPDAFHRDGVKMSVETRVNNAF